MISMPGNRRSSARRRPEACVCRCGVPPAGAEVRRAGVAVEHDDLFEMGRDGFYNETCTTACFKIAFDMDVSRDYMSVRAIRRSNGQQGESAGRISGMGIALRL
jgi:hypothetical protein